VAEATRRLNLYAKARWVVTNRLHVLLPCAAMGTPVVFVLSWFSLKWKIAVDGGGGKAHESIVRNYGFVFSGSGD
jgi:hypothetical protein